MTKHPRIKAWIRALANPHLLLCVGAAWFCTNGWAYCAAGIGYYMDWNWLFRIGSVYLGILWMPGTPEKLFTFGLAILFLKWWFPNDEKTLAMIRGKLTLLKTKTREEWGKIKKFFHISRKNGMNE